MTTESPTRRTNDSHAILIAEIAELRKELAAVKAEIERLTEACTKEFADAQKWSDEVCKLRSARLAECEIVITRGFQNGLHQNPAPEPELVPSPCASKKLVMPEPSKPMPEAVR